MIADRLPRSPRKRAALGVGVLAILALAGGVYFYVDKLPERLAADYREDAKPAAKQVTKAMDRVFFTFDLYLNDSTISRREIRDVENLDQYRRRVLPVARKQKRALDLAAQAVKNARLMIKRTRPELTSTSSAPLLGSSGPVQEARDAAEAARRYLARSNRYLKSYRRFIEYDRKSLRLARRDLKATSEPPNTDDIGELRAWTRDQLSKAKRTRRDKLRLKPHPDAKRLHELAVESATVTIDYLSEVEAGLETLDVVRLEAADRKVSAQYRRLLTEDSRAIHRFATQSTLQRSTRSLSKRADELQDEIGDVGSASAEEREPRSRPDPPTAPPRREQGPPGKLS